MRIRSLFIIEELLFSLELTVAVEGMRIGGENLTAVRDVNTLGDERRAAACAPFDRRASILWEY